MAGYSLSRLADEDIESIAGYTTIEFGLVQAQRQLQNVISPSADRDRVET